MGPSSSAYDYDVYIKLSVGLSPRGNLLMASDFKIVGYLFISGGEMEENKYLMFFSKSANISCSNFVKVKDKRQKTSHKFLIIVYFFGHHWRGCFVWKQNDLKHGLSSFWNVNYVVNLNQYG